MVRRIYDGETLFPKVRIDLAFLNGGDIFVIDLWSEDDSLARDFRLRFDLGGEFVGERVDFGEHASDLVGNRLAAFLVVDLETVIFLRVVAGGDHDAAASAHTAHRERQFGGGAQSVEDINLDPHFVEDVRAEEGKFAGHVAIVMRDADAHGFRFGILLKKVLSETDRRPSDGENVHAVGTGPEDAAHPAGSELDVLEERRIQNSWAHCPDRVFVSVANGRGIQPTTDIGFDSIFHQIIPT